MSGDQKLINGKDFNWDNIQVLLHGQPIEGITKVEYNKPKEPEWEYYHRRGDRFFFRNRYGIGMRIDLAPAESAKLLGVLKRGMRMDINHSFGGEITKEVHVEMDLIETKLNWPSLP